MRNVNIHEVVCRVEPEPKDYWDWIEQGHYQADFAAIKRFASPHATFIDAGAWVGSHTLYASRMYKSVHSLEPDPVAFEIFSRNVDHNFCGNVTIYESALAGHSGTIDIGSSILGCSCTRESCKENAVSVPCLTLREFTEDIPGSLVIKMDVEGAESRILEDIDFFAQRKPDLLLSTHLLWWKEAGSNGRTEYKTINKVGRLYRNVLHVDGGSHVDLNSDYGDVVFTDK